MKVRAKLQCNAAIPVTGGTTYYFHAVYSNEPNSENKAFTDATPSANLTIHVADTAPAAGRFEQGQSYYVDFTPVD